jgi:Tol biopolymer transport system component
MRTLFLALALTLVLAAAAASGATLTGRSRATRSGEKGEIAFSALVHGISQVFTIRPDGTRLRQVTHEPSDTGKYGLTWSPNGSSLLYTVNGNGKHGKDKIVKSAADGSGARVISPACTGHCLGADFPGYSPDGTKITFERAFGPIVNNNASVVAIFTMNTDGSHLTQLTQKTTPTSSEDHQPQWSPSGREIAFVRLNTRGKRYYESAIEVMNADGSNVRRLTPWSMRATDPRWSPNGQRILFNTYSEPVPLKSANLFTIRPDGTHSVQLTHYTGGTPQAFADAWSPDSTQILFERLNTSRNGEVGGYYILNLRNKQIHRLTPIRIHDHDPRAAWGK